MGYTDMVDVITERHRDIEAVFARLTAEGDHDEDRRRKLLDHAIGLLVTHAVVEDLYLYPAVRRHMAAGDDLAEHEHTEVARAEELMRQLEDMPATDPRFDDILAELARMVRRHIEEQQTEVLPKLSAACGPERLDELGEKVVETERHVSVPPHPDFPEPPRSAPTRVDAGPGLIDRIRAHLPDRAGD
ncbi:hemerythrin HHE cation binding domain-containing protein [Stackebrandtia albiflava]|uniref:Hemerythrin HHE cation binding domain-containing protein n=1 Tax=Stackebrandtia albiflava TaxID=406432 RepID=A0A562VDX2_9ACTN|nr:hemerythrin domain-containing protein [Stackebrandtia albiflava]TWJ16086.1 hemerythrin HHE cation binding domain-containing protein [Stackebrandtia albiflava]